jgi:hypothetical protein
VVVAIVRTRLDSAVLPFKARKAVTNTRVADPMTVAVFITHLHGAIIGRVACVTRTSSVELAGTMMRTHVLTLRPVAGRSHPSRKTLAESVFAHTILASKNAGPLTTVVLCPAVTASAHTVGHVTLAVSGAIVWTQLVLASEPCKASVTDAHAFVCANPVNASLCTRLLTASCALPPRVTTAGSRNACPTIVTLGITGTSLFRTINPFPTRVALACPRFAITFAMETTLLGTIFILARVSIIPLKAVTFAVETEAVTVTVGYT